MLPFLPGIVPFGVVTGFTPISFGFTWIDSCLGSLLMFAGASQLATYQLMNEGASIWVILLTVTAINLRYVLYSASIAPHLADANRLTRLLAGYGLSDQIYPICHRDYRTYDWGLEERIAYYVGGTLLLWGAMASMYDNWRFSWSSHPCVLVPRIYDPFDIFDASTPNIENDGSPDYRCVRCLGVLRRVRPTL